jgi:RNA polymerase sigma-54 factor
MKQKIEQIGKLTLQLKLTPGILLNLQLLQLPVLKLEEAILNEIEENPLLELEEEENSQEKEKEETVFDFVIEDGNVFLYEPEEETTFEIPSPTSLRESLLQQARLELNNKEFEIASLIIDNLDKKGYLTLSEEEIGNRLSVSIEDVKRVREKIKRFTPAGCGSYTLWEAFAVQLEELQTPLKFIEAVKKLELLKKGKKHFMEEIGLSEEEFEEFLCYLKRLDPEPGNTGDFNVKIVPDIRVSLSGEKIMVEIISPKTFALKINSGYLRYATTEEVKKYITEKYQRALNLKKAIDQRNETLRKVAEAVFEVQKEFLRDGKTLKPLSYQDIAEKLSIHESTISRAVKDKFVETPYGIYPFKYFFRKSLSGESTDNIKEKIRQIIESEDKKKPLSDSKIAEILKKEGIKIARRTVAKYREEMGIPGVFERRVRRQT